MALLRMRNSVENTTPRIHKKGRTVDAQIARRETHAQTADSSGSVSLLSNVQIVSGVAPHSHNLYIIMKMQGRPALTLPSLTGELLEQGPPDISKKKSCRPMGDVHSVKNVH
eukprot:scaffold4593_cov125-Isochrysis_galbana.AAC.4